MRDALAHVGASSAAPIGAMLARIFAQEGAEAAHEQLHHVACAQRTIRGARRHDGRLARPEARLHGVPQEALGAISSANLLERVSRGIKRSADVIGIFPNTDTVFRLVIAVMLDQVDEWFGGAPLFVETIDPLSDNPHILRPAQEAYHFWPAEERCSYTKQRHNPDDAVAIRFAPDPITSREHGSHMSYCMYLHSFIRNHGNNGRRFGAAS